MKTLTEKEYGVPDKCNACGKVYSYLKQSRAGMSIKELKKQHDNEVLELRSLCKHLHASGWVEVCDDSHAYLGYDATICLRCGAELERRCMCFKCGTETEMMEGDKPVKYCGDCSDSMSETEQGETELLDDLESKDSYSTE